MPVSPIHLLGEAASLGAAVMWACSMSLYSRFGRRVPAAGLNLYKNLVASSCLVITGLVLGFEWPLDPNRIVAFALSGLVGLALGDTLLFHGIKTIGVQRTSVIQCLAPPLTAVMAAWAFDERLNAWQWAGLLISAGALAWLVTSRSPSPAIHPIAAWRGVWAAVAAAICQAVAVMILRRSLQGVDVVTGTLLRVLPAIVGLSSLTFMRAGLEPLREVFRPARNGAILTLAAFIGTFIGLLLMSIGAKYAKAGVTTAITSTYPVWIMPISHFLLRERVSFKSMLLTLLAVAGVAIMMIGA